MAFLFLGNILKQYFWIDTDMYNVCCHDRRTVARCPAPCIAAPGFSARTRAVVAVSPATTATCSLTACSFLSVSYNRTGSKKHYICSPPVLLCIFLWTGNAPFTPRLYLNMYVPGGVFKTAFQCFALSVSNGELVSNGL